jgi:putative nucleotidyltransferase with HDIG domain
MILIITVMAFITVMSIFLNRLVRSKVKKSVEDLRNNVEEMSYENNLLKEKMELLDHENHDLKLELTKFSKMIDGFANIYSKPEFKSEIFNDVLELALSLVPEARAGSISIANGKRWEYVAIHGNGKSINDLKSADLNSEWMVMVPKVSIVENITNKNDKVPETHSKLIENAFGSHIYRSIAVPIKVGNDTIGNCFLDALDDLQFSESSKKIMEYFSTILSKLPMMNEVQSVGYININNTLRTIVNFYEMKCSNMRGHSENVGYLSTKIGEELGFSPKQLDDLYWGALFHDIGMIAIPDEIVDKPSKLTEEEFDTMKSHTMLGEKILSYHEHLKEVSIVAKYHHENFDGSGYPDGLKGGSIPLLARIVSVADTFEILRRENNHAPTLSLSEAMKNIEQNSGIQFDPEITVIAAKVFQNIPTR